MFKPETLIGLVERYSPSGEERNAVNWLVDRMQLLGFDNSFIDGVGNAVGVMGSGLRQVVLLGHIDTVPGEIPVRVENGVLHGRGSVDSKGPLSALTDAVAQVGKIDGWQFVVIGAVDEERDSQGARFVTDKYKPDFAIVGEPNRWDRIALGYKGSAWSHITLKREQSHSASGDQTASEAAVGAWLTIKTFVEKYNANKKRAFDKILPTLRGVETGEDEFEQWARLKIGTRLPVEISPEEWYAQLDEILQGADMEQIGYAIPAWGCEKNSQLVRAFLKSIRLEGGKPRFVYKTGTADLNIVAPVWQCPTVVFGPGDSTLDHTPYEHISLEEYDKGVSILANVLRLLCR